MLKTQTLWNDQQWVAGFAPRPEDYEQLAQQYQIPARFIKRIRDKKGRARFDYDFESQCSLFIFKVVAARSSANQEKARTTALIVLVSGNTIITLVQNHQEAVQKQVAAVMNDGLPNMVAHPSLIMLGMYLLFDFNERYFDYINDLDNLRQKLEKYKTSPSNDQIVRLSELSKSFVYLRAAVSGNLVAVRQLQAFADDDDAQPILSKKEDYWLRNLQTELEQARDLAQVNGEIVQQVTDAYANLLDKNLNTTMWVMTIWSLALAIPPIISGFYGMNVKLPIIGGWFDWPFTILLSLVPAVALILGLRRRRNLTSKDA
jgi:magnesium transporter